MEIKQYLCTQKVQSIKTQYKEYNRVILNSMKQNKEYWLRPIGKHKVSDIYMLNKYTCILPLETEIIDDKKSVQTTIEYWLDENAWRFNDNIIERETGDFVTSYKSANLTEEDKEECKKFIMAFLKEKGIVK